MAETQSQSRILVLSPVVERVVYSKPFQGDESREVFKEVKGRVAKDFKNAPDFSPDNYFEFNEKTGEINGSNTKYCILVDDVLSKGGLWLPTIVEAKKLDYAGMLNKGVYREQGIVVYNRENPNSEIAQLLINMAKKRAWQLPILAPFKALSLGKRAEIVFRKDAQGIITREEARKYLDEQVNYKGKNGVCGLYRDRGGSWVALDENLADSDSGGRVDFVCGEATQKNLEDAVLSGIDKEAQAETAGINARLLQARETALKVLRS